MTSLPPESGIQASGPFLKPTIASRSVAVLIGFFVVGLSVFLATRIHQHASIPVYLIPRIGELIVYGAVMANASAAIVAAILPRGWTIFLLETAFLSIFVGILLTLLGIPFLALGGGLIVVAYRLISRARRVTQVAIFLLAGLSALSMSLLFMAWNHPPLVDCETGGTSATYWFWGGSPGRTSGTAQTTPDGETRGSVSFDGKTYSYVCRDRELTGFKRSD